MISHRSTVSILVVSTLCLALLLVPARRAGAAEPIDLDLYARLLERHTRAANDRVGTRVDYPALVGSEDWKRLVAGVRSARPSLLERDARIAFWINAYNILTIDLILTHYPIESIKDIGSFFSPVWNVEVATIEGRALSLGQIEHDILRKSGEPRIHGAIVCASVSCPPLARTPFRKESLDGDLSNAMRRWLSSPTKGVAIDRGRGVVRISKIFDWFEDDFEPGGGVLKSIAPYLAKEDARWLEANADEVSIRYFDYDWALNELR